MSGYVQIAFHKNVMAKYSFTRFDPSFSLLFKKKRLLLFNLKCSEAWLRLCVLLSNDSFFEQNLFLDYEKILKSFLSLKLY